MPMRAHILIQGREFTSIPFDLQDEYGTFEDLAVVTDHSYAGPVRSQWATFDFESDDGRTIRGSWHSLGAWWLEEEE